MGKKFHWVISGVTFLAILFSGCQQPLVAPTRKPAKIVAPLDKTCVLNFVDTGVELLSKAHFPKIEGYVEMGRVVSPLVMKTFLNRQSSISQFKIGEHHFRIEEEGGKCYLSMDKNFSKPIKCRCVPVSQPAKR
jgi:hypothetical protein